MQQQSSKSNPLLLAKANRYCAFALVCMSVALACYSVLAFVISPASILGIIAIIAGVLFMGGACVCFALFAHYMNKGEPHQGK